MASEKLSASELNRILEKSPPPYNFDREPDSLLLEHLASLDRQTRENLITKEQYTPGEIFCREGNSGDAAYLIWAGQIELLAQRDLSRLASSPVFHPLWFM